MKTHELKCWSVSFQAIKRGVKTADLRRNDRNFSVGDILRLREYDPGLGVARYTGDEVRREITHIVSDTSFGTLRPDCVMLSLKVIS